MLGWAYAHARRAGSHADLPISALVKLSLQLVSFWGLGKLSIRMNEDDVAAWAALEPASCWFGASRGWPIRGAQRLQDNDEMRYKWVPSGFNQDRI